MAVLERFTAFKSASASRLNSYADEIERLSTAIFGNRVDSAKPIVKVAKTSQWTLGHGAGETISWDNSETDKLGMWSPSVPTQIQIPYPGVWQFVGQVKFGYNQRDGNRGTYITKNGESTQDDSIAAYEMKVSDITNAGTILQVVSGAVWAEGDIARMRAYQDNAASDTLAMGTTYGGTYLFGVWLGPA